MARLNLATAAAAALVALVGGVSAQTQQCQQIGDAMIVTIGTAQYNVAGYVAAPNSSGRTVIDSRDSSVDPYRYYVSVCNDITTPPSVTNSQGSAVYCANTCASGAPPPCTPQAYAPAYQVCYTGTTCNTNCYRLGGTYANAVYTAPMSGNVAHGFHVLYTGGDNCTSSGPARAASLMFLCQDSAGFQPSNNLVVESTTCVYNMMIFGRTGCPVQCPFGGLGNQLCGGNGVCDFDTSKGAPRCFCDQDYALDSEGNCLAPAGDSQKPPAPTNYGPNIAGGFFGGFFLGAALFVGYVAFLSRDNCGNFGDNFASVFAAGGSAGGNNNRKYEPAPSAAPSFMGGADTSSAYAPPSGTEGALLA